MIADIRITEKSFGDKRLISDVKFSVNDGEKVGLIGRNGVGKSTLFGMLAGADSDYRGSVVFRRGSTIVATAQEHHSLVILQCWNISCAGCRNMRGCGTF